MKRALITGITGQDGSYLAEFLLDKGYEVHGIRRRTSAFNTERIDHIRSRLNLYHGDVDDSANLIDLIDSVRPNEVYHLASQSHAQVSFTMPIYTADVTGLGTLRVLNAIRKSGKPIKFYQAGSSEMFGKVEETPQRETTPFHPRNPYAVSKVFAHWTTVNYREARGVFACNGILFNHESPRRGETFVTRKITRAVARIKAGHQIKLHLGNLDAKRDWGYAKEYVEAMWLMLQQPTPDDYVIATGETHSVREFVEAAFAHVDLDWRDYVDVDSKHYRPAEVDLLVGDAGKARKQLGWTPQTKFNELVRLMVDADLAVVKAK